MAEKKAATKDDSSIVKPIILTNSVTGDIYVLEFNRDSVKFAESRGFDIQNFDSGKIYTVSEDLFFYAFRMHHPNISRAETDRFLHDQLRGFKPGMLDHLIDLYLAPVKSLAQTEEDAKNATMTAEW